MHYLCGPKTGKYYEIDWRPEDFEACLAEFDGDGLAMAEAYYANVAKVAAMAPDILGHVDLIKKLNGDGRYFDENAPRYLTAASGALEAAKAAGCVLEINTGAVYRGFRKDFYPSDGLLRLWREMGGRVTITADAHTAESLTFGYDQAAEKAKAAGFAQVQVLTKEGFVPCDL